MVEMDKRVEVLLEAHKSGKLSRRDFIYRAGLIFGTVTIGGVILGNDLPPVHAQGNPTATLTGTAMPEGGETIALTTQMIEVETATTPVPAYHAYPEGGTNLPGVVVIQEWWGLDDHIKSVAELMARNGFAAIAPDLYRGEVATEPNEARKLAMELVMDQAIGDVQGAADFLVAQDYVEPKKVGVMGFCMGGRIAMQMSWEGTDSIGAVATFYGGGLNPTDDQFKAVKVPVLGLYGADDGGIPVSSVRNWEAKFKEFGKINEMVIYEGAPHAFFNDTRPSFRPEAAKDALARTLAWFKKYLTA
ncbi:MAG: dienelactone hydrolase family protein [Anaerolineae bacterium]